MSLLVLVRHVTLEEAMVLDPTRIMYNRPVNRIFRRVA